MKQMKQRSLIAVLEEAKMLTYDDSDEIIVNADASNEAKFARNFGVYSRYGEEEPEQYSEMWWHYVHFEDEFDKE